MTEVRNTESSVWVEATNWRGEPWKHKDFSGERLGVRIEEIAPGGRSSEHHYHLTEEEHVIVLKGEATLVVGDDRKTLKEGDHCWFRAGEEMAHHLLNASDSPFQFLVFGERKNDDVVVYPEHQVMMIKGLSNRQVTYRSLVPGDGE